MKTNNKIQKMKTLALMLIALFAVSSFTNAATTIKGRVLSSSYQPISYATATIIHPKSMKIVEGDMCNDNGEFIIEKVEPGEYILSIRIVGYQKDETRKIRINDKYEIVEIKPILLQEDNVLLNELLVVVKSQTNHVHKNS